MFLNKKCPKLPHKKRIPNPKTYKLVSPREGKYLFREGQEKKKGETKRKKTRKEKARRARHPRGGRQENQGGERRKEERGPRHQKKKQRRPEANQTKKAHKGRSRLWENRAATKAR